MGIRCVCPNGHRLNVKESQAGQRGICPHCGAKVQIPATSTDASPGESVSADAATPPPRVPEPGAAAAPEAQKPSGDSSVVLRVGTPPVGTSAPGSGPAVASPGAATERGWATPAGPGLPGVGDVLAEAGDVVWYVRPASGGQFGPASSETMRSWLREDRVGADSLVWREGWPDWRRAVQVFPQLDAARADGPLPQIAVPETSLATARKSRTGPRRKSRSRQTTLLTGLVVAAIVLLTILVFVVSRAFGDATARADGPATSVSRPCSDRPSPPLA